MCWIFTSTFLSGFLSVGLLGFVILQLLIFCGWGVIRYGLKKSVGSMWYLCGFLFLLARLCRLISVIGAGMRLGGFGRNSLFDVDQRAAAHFSLSLGGIAHAKRMLRGFLPEFVQVLCHHVVWLAVLAGHDQLRAVAGLHDTVRVGSQHLALAAVE